MTNDCNTASGPETREPNARPSPRPPPSKAPSFRPTHLPPEEEPVKPTYEPPRRLGLKEEFTARGRASRAALRAAAPDASASEQIIYDLVADQTAIAMALMDAQAELVTRIGACIEEPRLALALGKVLLQVTTLSNSVGSRIEKALTVADSLRAHRRLWRAEKHGTTQ